MLHSLGPGHGKVIVTTYLATHPTKVKTSLILTVISSLCQALVAILLVSVLVWGFHASMQSVNLKAMFFVSLSFALVTVLGGLICWKAFRQIFRSFYPKKLKVNTVTPFKLAANEPIKPFSLKSVVLAPATPTNAAHSDHEHHDGCGCGHQHVVDADAINQASTLREYVGIIATIGVRPCTGAIMVLLFANMVGLYWMGVVSAVVMAAGTALTTSIIAVMTLTGKLLVKRYLMTGNQSNNSWKLAGYGLQLFGGLLLVLFGLLMVGSQDFGMSPVFSV
jgi:nickel/cobalt exporter